MKLYALSTHGMLSSHGMLIQRSSGGGRTVARRAGRGGRAAARGRRRGGGGAGDGPRHGAVLPPGRPVPLAQGAPGAGGLAHVCRHRHRAGAPKFVMQASDFRIYQGTTSKEEKLSQALYELEGLLELEHRWRRSLKGHQAFSHAPAAGTREERCDARAMRRCCLARPRTRAWRRCCR